MERTWAEPETADIGGSRWAPQKFGKLIVTVFAPYVAKILNDEGNVLAETQHPYDRQGCIAACLAIARKPLGELYLGCEGPPSPFLCSECGDPATTEVQCGWSARYNCGQYAPLCEACYASRLAEDPPWVRDPSKGY